MKITTKLIVNLKTKEAVREVERAAKQALKNVVVLIANDAKKDSPYLTGHNRRSIMFEVGPGGQFAKTDLQGAIYSTSGYGGFLETGTVKMAARPYLKPALDRHIKKLPEEIKAVLK